MHAPAERSNRSLSAAGVAGVAVLMLFLMPMLYVLSMGPAAKATELLGIDKGPVKLFYAPVIWLHDHTPLKKPLEWYLGLFGVK